MPQPFGWSLRAIFTAVLILTAVTGLTVAGPLEDGVTALDSGDTATALQLLRPLADQGNAVAQFVLGTMYVGGRGVRQDYAEAARWYRLAAEQGHPWAQSALGFFFVNGRGVPKNYVLAHMWLNLAATLPFDFPFGSAKIVNEKDQREFQEIAAGARDKLALEMTPAQIAEAQKLAREWKPQSE